MVNFTHRNINTYLNKFFQFSELNATNDSISLTVSLNDKLNDIVVSEYNFDIDIPETDKTITTQTTPLATTTSMPSFKVLEIFLILYLNLF